MAYVTLRATECLTLRQARREVLIHSSLIQRVQLDDAIFWQSPSNGLISVSFAAAGGGSKNWSTHGGLLYL